MCSPTSLYLAKDVMTKAGRGWNPLYAMNGRIARDQDSLVGESPLIDALVNYVNQLPKRDILLTFGFGFSQRHHHQSYFYAYLPKVVVENLCRILPQSYFHISGRIPEGGSSNVITFEKRLELSYILTEPRVGQDQFYKRRILSRNSGTRENYSCDILLGWSDPRGIRKQATPYLEGLQEWDSSKDLILVAGNNAELKCHRHVFAAQSDVLAAMVSVQNGMQEGQTGRVQLPEISEEGLSHLLRYFHSHELSTNDLPCGVAVELFCTAHKYKLTELEEVLAKFFLRMRTEWYTPDGLLELYFHVKNLEEHRHLRDHILCHIMNLYQEIRSCDAFEELLRLDPKGVIELAWALFEMK